MTSPELTKWADFIEKILPTSHGVVRRIILLAETDSTQTRAMDEGRCAGDLIVAGRQALGRGRRGNFWTDTLDAGIAASFVLPLQGIERLSIAMAVAMAKTGESVTGKRLSIKWPNDLFYAGKKCGGVLVEQSTFETLIAGVGINISKRAWPEDLKDHAITFEEIAGRQLERLDVLIELIYQVDWALSQQVEMLEDFFKTRCLLTGRVVILTQGKKEVKGTVRRVDPLRGLEVESNVGLQWIPGASASIKEIL